MKSFDPFRVDVLWFGNAVHRIFGNACIAGSAPLAKCLYGMGDSIPSVGVKSWLCKLGSRTMCNDVDIFVPFDPQTLSFDMKISDMYTRADLMVIRSSYSEKKKIIVDRYRRHLFRSVEVFMERCYGVECIISDANSCPRKPLGIGSYYGWTLPYKARIDSIHDVSLIWGGSAYPVRIQMIMVDVLPEPRESWEEAIIERFDVDICRGIVSLSDPDDLGKLVLPDDTKQNIVNGRFEFTFRPGVRFEVYAKRIYKYINRGFVLSKISFHDGCTVDYMKYVNETLCRLFAPRLCIGAMIAAGFDRETAVGVFDQHMMHYLAVDSLRTRRFIETIHILDNIADACRQCEGEIYYIRQIEDTESYDEIEETKRGVATGVISLWMRKLIRTRRTGRVIEIGSAIFLRKRVFSEVE